MTWQDQTYGWQTPTHTQLLPPPPPPRRSGVSGVLIGLAVLLMLVAGGLAYLAGSGMAGGGLSVAQHSRITDLPTTAAGAGNNPGAAIDPALAEKVNPAIVDINTTLGFQRAQAAGTGIVLSADGLVLTNNHVIADATSINATDVGDGRTYEVSVLGYDKSRDVALVQLDGASGLATATLGDSADLSVGQAVMALGNAGGVGGTPSAVTGNITALNQSITATDESGEAERLTGLIEVDANIQPGDSGGPLVDASGAVIGMDTAATSSFRMQQAGTSRGYAIPVNQAMEIVNQIKAGQASETVHIGETAFLGVQTVVVRRSAGAAVVSVVADSPAARAGLDAGDIIIALNGAEVDSPTTLGELMSGRHPDETVTLGWTDSGGQNHSAQVVLASGPPA
jgi:S1-C subfamily serine protease